MKAIFLDAMIAFDLAMMMNGTKVTFGQPVHFNGNKLCATLFLQRGQTDRKLKRVCVSVNLSLLPPGNYSFLDGFTVCLSNEDGIQHIIRLTPISSVQLFGAIDGMKAGEAFTLVTSTWPCAMT